MPALAPNHFGPRTEGLRRRLALAHRQLLAYAVDIKQLLSRLQEREQELEKAQDAARFYAHQLENSLQAAQARTEELENAHNETVFRLFQATKLRDCETGVHLRCIATLSALLAEELGLPEDEVERIREASKLHDIGKIGIPDSILKKQGPLSADEWTTMRRHTIIGAGLLAGSTSPLLECAERIALHHHEHWDGSGYPHGLRGEAIPLAARIVTLCDHYDALRSERPYKPALDHPTVRKILLEGDRKTRPQHFDPQLLDAFKRLDDRFEKVWDDLRRTPLAA